MKLNTRKTTTIWSMLIAMALLLCVVLFFVIRASHTQAFEGEGRLVTIYDRGQERVVLTEAETIGDAIAEANIEIDARDVVEPRTDEKMIANEYRVNIYRARPVTVVDGAVKQRVMTAYQTPEQILSDIGVKLHDEDTTMLEQSDDYIASGAGLELTIDRATPFALDLFGSKTDARTQGETVGEMLKEKGIELSDNDRVVPSVDTPLSKDLSVRIWREGIQTVTVEEKIKFSIRQVQDADRPVGYKAIKTEGQDGARKVTYQIEIKDGREVSREEIATLTLQKAVTQIEVVGTKPEFMPYTGGGTKTEWLAASNIAEENWGYADSLVTRESGWNPNAINTSSGACGLAQALPCSKVPGDPLNPVNSLNWMNDYVIGRYGGWQQAYNFWQANHWY